MKAVLPYCIAALVAAFIPESTWAWAPGTHLKFAEVVLTNRHLLDAGLASLLAAHSALFMYGNIIADLILGKDVGIEYKQHSHNWDVARALLDRAGTPQLKAMAWGYLCHLAADVIAHNIYVPEQTVHAAPGRGYGHAFWEMHYDAHVPKHYLDATVELERVGRSEADRFLMRELVETLLSHRTNRWIFTGQLIVQRMHAYRVVMRRSLQRSPYRVGLDSVRFFDDLSLRAIADLLLNNGAVVGRHDPTGRAALARAKNLKRLWRESRADRGTPRDFPPPPERTSVRSLFLGDLAQLDPHPFALASDAPTPAG